MNLSQLQFAKPFQYRDFRYLYIAEICFFISMWMAVMVYGLITTHIKGKSPLYQGLIGFGFNLPMLFGPYIGAIVDRYQRKTILRIVATIAVMTALTMALLLFGGWPNFWVMFAIVIVQGFVLVFYLTALTTSAHDIIKNPNDLANGIGIVNATNRIAMFFGYSGGGLLIIWFGEQFTYWFNAVLYFFAVLLLMRMTTTVTLSNKKKSVISELTLGFKYLKTSSPIIAVLVLLALMGFFAWPFLFQMPAVNRYYLHGTAAHLGMLMAMGGAGGIAGSFLMSARKNVLGLNWIIITSTALLVISLLFLSQCRSVFWATYALFLIDFSLMIALIAGTVFVQQITPSKYQGRVIGVLYTCAFGTIPFGSTLFYGGVGTPLGVMTAFAIAAVILFFGMIGYWMQLPKIRRHVAPIYLKKGIIQEASELKKI